MAEKMNYCPECGKLYEVKVTECKECKTALEEAIPVKFCHKCRERHSLSARECPNFKTHKLMDAYYTPKYPKPKPIPEKPKNKPVRKSTKASIDWPDDL